MTKEERKTIEKDLQEHEQQLQHLREAQKRVEGVIIYLRQKLEEKEATSGGQKT